MKESYGEDLASHSGLVSYAEHGNVLGVASARGTGRPAIELRNQTLLSCADAVVAVEGNTHALRYRRAAVRHDGVVEPEHA
jgi:hypothetical protein